jgi:hypothetical protein
MGIPLQQPKCDQRVEKVACGAAMDAEHPRDIRSLARLPIKRCEHIQFNRAEQHFGTSIAGTQ